MNEQELAKFVVDWLEKREWEVYQEVETGRLCSRADIVGLKNGLTWIIECKTRHGFQVMNQAIKWMNKNAANFISVATPRPRKHRSDYISWYLHRDKGIGFISVDPAGFIQTRFPPKLIRTRPTFNIKNILSEDHKYFAKAGAADGGYFTPFKRTVRDILEYIKDHPGCTIKEMVDAMDGFHYSNVQSARGSIAKYLRMGIIDGVRIVVERRKYKLYLESDGTPDEKSEDNELSE